jgi:4-diphosphocytidyl-2-C-methyl-D-erythritol kinase
MALIRVSAYAKINLFLAVLGRRPDGFHDIFTVMRRTSLCDEVSVETVADGRGDIELSVIGGEDVPTDSGNLAYRAAEGYLERAGIRDSVKITLEKKIPARAGLGGGSADAAATLRALERIYGALDSTEILDIAASLGSDVPFCIFGWTAVCEGRGEIITPVTDKRKMHLVIAKKERSVSTPAAFSRIDEAKELGKIPKAPQDECYSALLKYLANEGELPTTLYNSFEFSLGELEEDILDLKKKMRDFGALGALMSGSGPSVVGIFPDEKSAALCVDTLLKSGVFAYYSN